MDTERLSVNALGDQIQAVCRNSGLKVVGFTVMVRADDQGVTTESRTTADNMEYIRTLAVYAATELEAGDVGWSPT